MKDVKNIERVRKWQKKQKSKGLCIECSNPTSGLRCDACNKRRSEYRKRKKTEWKENGLCNQCGKETINGKNQCEKHYLMQVAIDRLGTSKFWKDIKDVIQKQEYKCALTKENISFEDDIDLDHIIPTSRGGKNEISNVRWVTRKANRLKNNLTDKELKDICLKIVQNL